MVSGSDVDSVGAWGVASEIRALASDSACKEGELFSISVVDAIVINPRTGSPLGVHFLLP